MPSSAEPLDAPRFLPPRATAFLRRKFIQAAAAGLVLTGLFLGLALLAYDPLDPSWNTAADAPIGNWLGPAGAVIADLTMQSIGLGGIAAALILGLWGWRILRRGETAISKKQAAALPMALPAWAMAAAALPPPAGWGPGAGWGGVLGTALGQAGGGVLEPWLPFPYALTGLAAFIAGLALGGCALGVTWADWRRAGSALWRWIVRAYALGRMVLSRFVESRRRAARPTAAAVPGDPPIADDLIAPAKPPKAAARTGRRAVAQRRDLLSLEAESHYTPPGLGLLQTPPRIAGNKRQMDEGTLAQNARLLETVLEDFNIQGEIIKVRPGPIVTLYELRPAPGTKAARVIGLADDIARSMSALSARIAAIPGRNAIGIELPNQSRETVYLREQLASRDFENDKALLPLALGKDIGGGPVIADLAKMPHLLIAGTTGSGKSVAVNAMILSLLYRMPPEACRLVMIDPKMLELSVYDDIPHLLSPVVTDPKKAVSALKWTVREMENRYRMMSNMGVRSIAGFNERIAKARRKGEVLTRRVQTGFDPETGRPVFEDVPLDLNSLPLIVVVVDEMADLMMTAGKEIEAAIQRLSQMARAAGIHLIMATQRPSVDVITGTIKANFPTRISFQVTSKIDSRTILGEQGAEQLLGQGDMLYMAAGGRIQRVHGPFVADHEVEQVVAHLRAQGAPQYVEEVTEDAPESQDAAGDLIGGDSGDSLYDQAVAVVAREGKASTSFIQRHLQIGYNRAARLVERMESEGVIGPANHVGKREVLLGRPDVH